MIEGKSYDYNNGVQDSFFQTVNADWQQQVILPNSHGSEFSLRQHDTIDDFQSTKQGNSNEICRQLHNSYNNKSSDLNSLGTESFHVQPIPSFSTDAFSHFSTTFRALPTFNATTYEEGSEMETSKAILTTKVAASTLNSFTNLSIHSTTNKKLNYKGQKCINKSTRHGRGNARATNSEKSEKPPHTYISLIAKAIQAQPSKTATLAEIYQYLRENHEFFRGKYVGWKNSIRHNLSIGGCFKKLPKNNSKILGMNEKKVGKGHQWAIGPELACDGKQQRRSRLTPNSGEVGLDATTPTTFLAKPSSSDTIVFPLIPQSNDEQSASEINLPTTITKANKEKNSQRKKSKRPTNKMMKTIKSDTVNNNNNNVVDNDGNCNKNDYEDNANSTSLLQYGYANAENVYSYSIPIAATTVSANAFNSSGFGMYANEPSSFAFVGSYHFPSSVNFQNNDNSFYNCNNALELPHFYPINASDALSDKITNEHVYSSTEGANISAGLNQSGWPFALDTSLISTAPPYSQAYAVLNFCDFPSSVTTSNSTYENSPAYVDQSTVTVPTEYPQQFNLDLNELEEKGNLLNSNSCYVNSDAILNSADYFQNQTFLYKSSCN